MSIPNQGVKNPVHKERGGLVDVWGVEPLAVWHPLAGSAVIRTASHPCAVRVLSSYSVAPEGASWGDRRPDSHRTPHYSMLNQSTAEGSVEDLHEALGIPVEVLDGLSTLADVQSHKALLGSFDHLKLRGGSNLPEVLPRSSLPALVVLRG